MPYQKIPKALRPLYLKGLSSSRYLKQGQHLDLISNYTNSSYHFNNVSKLEIIFKQHSSYGHLGMKKFWKNNLKTIYYHNPSLIIDVKRIDCQEKEQQLNCPCIIKTITKDNKEIIINGKDKHSDDIMKELVEKTAAVAVPSEDIISYSSLIEERR
ncbi:mitochondrial 54S ribosomal protein [Pichia kluyveri]|uniref:Mitochondrial 54S ribosomal protein n=1 Tax=Pichia kluyveri TaxID=36015 RepID=A0AAV5RBF2_PICKL|nr:mitochondrial 54S ribosomal protein [Pichia kluyveri]